MVALLWEEWIQCDEHHVNQEVRYHKGIHNITTNSDLIRL